MDPEDVREAPRRVREGPLQHPHRPHASHPQRHDKGRILSILLRFLPYDFVTYCVFFSGIFRIRRIGN